MRDCDRCIHYVGGKCSSWECKFEIFKETIKYPRDLLITEDVIRDFEERVGVRFINKTECSKALSEHDAKVRADAIDEVYKNAEEKVREQIEFLTQSPWRNGKAWARYMVTYLRQIKTACEQLKERKE